MPFHDTFGSDSRADENRMLRLNTAKRVLLLDSMYSDRHEHDSLEKAKHHLFEACNPRKRDGERRWSEGVELDAWELTRFLAHSFRSHRNLCWALFEMLAANHLDFRFVQDDDVEGIRLGFDIRRSKTNEVMRLSRDPLVLLVKGQSKEPDRSPPRYVDDLAQLNKQDAKPQQIKTAQKPNDEQQLKPEQIALPFRNGPGSALKDAGIFHWEGVASLELEGRVWRLLNFLWHHPEPTVAEVLIGVWPDGSCKSVKSTLWHLNKALGAAGIPFFWSQKNGRLRRVDLSQDGARPSVSN